MVYQEESIPAAGIDAVWTLAVQHDLSDSLPYLTLPDGCTDLIYRVKRDLAGRIDYASLLVAGPTDRAATFFPCAGEEFVGVRFAPGWGHEALKFSPVELFGAFASAKDLTLRLAHLENTLFGCSSQKEAAATLRRTAESWADENTNHIQTLQAVQMLRISGGRMRIDDAVSHLGMSTRNFRREVKALTGLSPKSLNRIFRFRQTLERLRECNKIGLGQLALGAGYSDQAHMTREFVRLGGFTPKCPSNLPLNTSRMEMD